MAQITTRAICLVHVFARRRGDLRSGDSSSIGRKQLTAVYLRLDILGQVEFAQIAWQARIPGRGPARLSPELEAAGPWLR